MNIAVTIEQVKWMSKNQHKVQRWMSRKNDITMSITIVLNYLLKYF